MEYVCYVIVKDLPTMSAGRIAAQTNHAGTSMISKLYDNSILKIWGQKDLVGTTIVLKASPEEFIYYFSKLSTDEGKNKDFYFDSFTDHSYNITINGTKQYIKLETCMWVLGSKVVIKPLLEGLKLL